MCAQIELFSDCARRTNFRIYYSMSLPLERGCTLVWSYHVMTPFLEKRCVAKAHPLEQSGAIILLSEVDAFVRRG